MRRPSDESARWLAVALAALLIATCGAFFAPGAAGENSNAVLQANASRILPFVWLFVESFVQYSSMRRRDHLGVGDPIVTNRFLLWSVSTGLLAAFPIVVMGFRIALRVMSQGLVGEELEAANDQVLGHLRIVLLFAGVGIASSVSQSFFPSRRYLHWVKTRAEAGAA